MTFVGTLFRLYAQKDTLTSPQFNFYVKIHVTISHTSDAALHQAEIKV